MIGALLLGACTNEPMYIPGPTNIEAGVDDGMGGISAATASLTLPVKTETAADMTKRMTLATQLGIDVPYVKVDDVAISIEYTIKNLDTDNPGQAFIDLNGATEFFVYDPTMIVLDPLDDEAPKTPPLQGDIPIDVPPGGTVTGLFTEDNLLEASIDCDAVTRGHINPFAAHLQIDKNDTQFQPQTPPDPMDPDAVATPTGPAVPREAFASLIRVDLVFHPDSHMVLDYDVRVRDKRGIMDDEQLQAPAADLEQFMPAAYAP
ncbi:MAG TPA: hypothetical protein VGM88_34240 [Kofleriaceae bacterium]